ncbi:MAG TPA: hypothetical protein VL979_10190 [Solirubrobacteraceae bacterium]|nr:hypothetical protein [Solirubrobacteraceae bacterium]
MSEQRPRTESELVELVRAIDVSAPAHVHERVRGLVQARSRTPRRRPAPLRFGLAAVGLACVLALALALALSGGGGARVTLQETVAFTLRRPTMPAPAESPRHGEELAARVEGVSFPYWGERFGWRATGARMDRVDGRSVTTVFYADRRGQWLGYAIVSGTPAPASAGGAVVRRDGVSYRFMVEHGARVVTWLRDGRLCVISARGIDPARLLALASWGERATAS